MLEEPRLKAAKPLERSVPVDNMNPIHLWSLYIVKGLFHRADMGDTPLPQGPIVGSIYCNRLTLWNEHKRYLLAHGPWVHHTTD